MGTAIGILAIGLMSVVIVIAAASLLIAGALPFAKLRQRWRARKSD
ncbi:MAG: hypothetical protein ACR2P0_04800 [Acidimicrobiales bacterium]